MLVNNNKRSFAQFLKPLQENTMYAPHETSNNHSQASELPKCSYCSDCATKIAEQAELIAELQAQVASQQQELSSRDFVSNLYQ